MAPDQPVARWISGIDVRALDDSAVVRSVSKGVVNLVLNTRVIEAHSRLATPLNSRDFTPLPREARAASNPLSLIADGVAAGVSQYGI